MREEQSVIIFQNGGAFGTSSWLTPVPDQEIGVFVVTNTSGPDIHQNLQKSAMDIINLVSE